MKDYIVYHNPDVMGYPASQVNTLEIVTNHVAKKATDGRVWLLTGEGRPRKYYLRLYFTIESVGSGEDVGFRTRVSGTNGKIFDPMPNLDGEDWLPGLKRDTGNFSFGFRAIRSPRITDGLEKVAGISAKAAGSN